MLYTVVPLERIYCNMRERVGGSSKSIRGNEISYSEIEHVTIELEHGKIYAKKYADDYVIEQIVSTNMKDYLNPQFNPGNIIKIK